jgi:hypothetical protein
MPRLSTRFGPNAYHDRSILQVDVDFERPLICTFALPFEESTDGKEASPLRDRVFVKFALENRFAPHVDRRQLRGELRRSFRDKNTIAYGRILDTFGNTQRRNVVSRAHVVKKFGCTRTELEAAVKKAGPMVRDVEKQLKAN